MKRVIYKYTALLLVLLQFSSCSEDLLDKKPVGLIDNANYLQTEEEAELAMFGLYDFLSVGYNNYNDWSSIFFAKIMPGDDVNPGGGNSGDQEKWQVIGKFKHGADNIALQDVWLSQYRLVNSANTIINNVGDLKSRNRIIAEAKFFRGFSYFELVTMFGNVPFFEVNAASKADENKPRTDKKIIYKEIEDDLLEAIKYLPSKSEYSDAMKFRASKGSAQALLGKVYLYQKEYAKAANMFEQVIGSGEYSMKTPYQNIWSLDERGGDESLFEVVYTNTNGHDWSGPWDGTAESNMMMQLMGPRGDNSFNKLDTIQYIDGYGSGYINGWGFVVPTKKIGDLLVNEAGDIRAKASVIPEDVFVAGGGEVNSPANVVGTERTVGNNNWDAYEGYIRLKYCTRTTTTGGPVNEMNHAISFKLIRYADVLLMAAEAYNAIQEDAKAVALIKLVRERAGLNDHSSWESLTGTALFEFIVEERSLELAFEGHRFWDLVRWDKAEKELKDLGFVKGKHEVYPIPRQEIDLNPGISPSDQNPGY